MILSLTNVSPPENQLNNQNLLNIPFPKRLFWNERTCQSSKLFIRLNIP